MDRGGLPGGIVVIRRVPVGDLLFRLNPFAAITPAHPLAQRSDVTGASLPRGVGDDRLLCGSVERQVHLGLHHRADRARVLEHAERPAPTKPQGDAVLAFDEVFGDVVGQVQPSFAVIRHGRAEYVVAHLLAVHIKFIVAQRTDVSRGRGRDLFEHDGLTQPGQRPRVVLHPVGPDPLAAPVGRRKRSHAEVCRLAPRRLRAGLVPHADLPPAAGSHGQRPARIGHPLRLVRRDLARVPQRSPPLGQRLGRVGHEHLASRLLEPPGTQRNRP